MRLGRRGRLYLAAGALVAIVAAAAVGVMLIKALRFLIELPAALL